MSWVEYHRAKEIDYEPGSDDGIRRGDGDRAGGEAPMDQPKVKARRYASQEPLPLMSKVLPVLSKGPRDTLANPAACYFKTYN